MINNEQFKAKISRPEIESLPRKKFPGEIFYIDSYTAMHKLLPEMQNKKILGFDTETKPTFKKGVTNEVSLLQLSTSDRAFLFRINHLGIPDELNPFYLADSSICRIMLRNLVLKITG